MAIAEQLRETGAEDLANRWLAAFEGALANSDADGAASLFLADGHWRDLLAFTWSIRTEDGADAIREALRRTLAPTRPRDFHLPEGREAPRVVTRAGRDIVEAIFAFETELGRANGVLRLVADPEAAAGGRAWILLTALDEIKGHEELNGERRPDGECYSREFGGENWLDQRVREQTYEDHEPTVLVVGGGQCGLGIAACLGQLGLDTLVVDRHERVGDAWRKRYRSLTLHNQVYINHLPYLPFPANWPIYIPKDKIANWMEFYAKAMELNIWCETAPVGGDYDEAAGCWEIRLRRADGTEKLVRPRHVVFATGVSGIPIRPDLPGLKDFAGTVMHSGDYKSGGEWDGKKALVLGTGNSGHDVAQDLHAHGCDVTMIQRGTTLIVELDTAQKVYDMYQEGPSLEDCDLLATAMPYKPLVSAYQIASKMMRERDTELLDGLTARGFRLDYGPPDDTGYQMKYLRRGGGYYFNVGCSDLIVDGGIGLEQFSDVDRFVPEGPRMKDGRVVEADLLVTATGYENRREMARLILGDEVAERIGPVWGFDEGGEQRNMWRRTPQPGLWFTAGGLPHVRIYSKYLAMQIKACEAGLLDPAELEGARA